MNNFINLTNIDPKQMDFYLKFPVISNSIVIKVNN